MVLHLTATDKDTFNRKDYLDLVNEDFKDSPKRTGKFTITTIKNAGEQTIVDGTSTETNGQEMIKGKWRINLSRQGNKILIIQMELFAIGLNQ